MFLDLTQFSDKIAFLSKSTGPSGSKSRKAEKRLMINFSYRFTMGTPHEADRKEGLVVIKILDALYRSTETERPVIF